MSIDKEAYDALTQAMVDHSNTTEEVRLDVGIYIITFEPFARWVRCDISRPYRDGRKKRAWVTVHHDRPPRGSKPLTTAAATRHFSPLAYRCLQRLEDEAWFEQQPDVLDHTGVEVQSPHG